MLIRYSKILLVWMVALFASLVVLNNITDYGTNYEFVAHVLLMDTTLPGNNGMWRAIESDVLHHSAYALITLVEAVIAVLCWLGGWRMYRAVSDARRFNGAKDMAVAGLVLGVTLWFGGFIVIGAEWFLMWQSDTWNGQQAAFRFAAMLMLFLIYVVMPDRADDSTP